MVQLAEKRAFRRSGRI